MGAHNSENSKTNFYALKAKTSETDPTPFFGKNTKTGDGWKITETFNSFSGNLVKIEHSTYEHQGETKHKCKMTLKDGEETNTIESNFNNLLYSLLNALASSESLGNILMTLFLGKAKIIDGKEGKRYPSIWVKNNGVDLKWKYNFEETPKPKKVKVGGKTVADDSEVVEFWKNVIVTEINPNLNLKSEVKPSSNVSPVMDEKDDSLLF